MPVQILIQKLQIVGEKQFGDHSVELDPSKTVAPLAPPVLGSRGIGTFTLTFDRDSPSAQARTVALPPVGLFCSHRAIAQAEILAGTRNSRRTDLRLLDWSIRWSNWSAAWRAFGLFSTHAGRKEMPIDRVSAFWNNTR